MSGATLLLLLLAVSGCGRTGQGAPESELPRIRRAPDFTCINYDGHTVTQNDLRGRIWIASFFFSSCSGPCPVMNSNANVLQAEFADMPDFRIVSFTVDPETDTPERLAHYAQRYAAKSGRWYMLRTSEDSVAELSTGGFMMGDRNHPTMHSTRFALVDRDGMIRGYYDGLDPQRVDALRKAIAQLAQERG
jgi:protein SCO1/2